MIRDNEKLHVFLKFIEPGAGCFVTDAITSPYKFVKINFTGEVLVTEIKESTDCTSI